MIGRMRLSRTQLYMAVTSVGWAAKWSRGAAPLGPRHVPGVFAWAPQPGNTYIRDSGLFRIQRVNVRRSVESVGSTPLQARICELMQQSKHHQAEISRITEELERLQAQIRDIGSPKLKDATPQQNADRDERRA